MELAEKYILEKRYEDGFVLIAEMQTKGRGRKGNNWVSPKGGLWFSIVLNHISQQKTFTLYVGHCILMALNELVNKSVLHPLIEGENGMFSIKWPNDIYFENKKVCGLICSQYAQHNKTLIGIGINTNVDNVPEDAPEHFGSISELLGVTIENNIYLDKIISNILDGLSDFEENGIAIFYDCYKRHDYLRDKMIRVTSGNEVFSGMYKGVDEDGGLVMEMRDGEDKRIYSGSVFIEM